MNETKSVPQFDPDFSPAHEINVEAARLRQLKYDSKRKVYVDEDGCPTLDRFGQPLG
jgi:hypothetical protein